MSDFVAASPWPLRVRMGVLLLGFGVLSVVVAFAVVVLNGWLALLIVLPVLAVLVTFFDYRIGVVLLILAGTASHLNVLPKFTGFNVFTYLVIAPALPLFARALGAHRPFVRLPPALLAGYLLPITIAALIGTRYIHLMPWFMVAKHHLTSFGTWIYLKTDYLKPMLFVLAAWLIANAVRDSRDRELWLWPVVIALAACSGVILLIVALLGADLAQLSHDRAFVGGIGWHNNEMGMLLATGFGPLLFAATTMRRPGLRLCTWLVLGLTAAAITLTFSRGAFLAMAAVGAYYLIVRRQAAVLVAGVLVAALGLVLAPDAVKERLSLGIGQQDSRSGLRALGRMDDKLTAGRVGMWAILAPEVLESPLVGRGINSTYWSAGVRSGQIDATHPHSMYLRAMLDMGLLGSLALGAFAIWLIRAFRRAGADPEVDEPLRGFLYGGSAAVLAILVHGATNGDFMPNREHWFLWICFGFLLVYLRREAPMRRA